MIRHAVVLIALSAAPALAQEALRLQPARDVAVTYRVEGVAAQVVPGAGPGTMRLLWDAAGQRARLEPSGQPVALLADLRAGTALVLDRGMNAALALPVRPEQVQAFTLQGVPGTRRGQATVAGLACTEYAVQSSRGTGTLCVTADGVPLRGSGTVGGRAGSFTGLAVEYAPQPATAFQVPPGMLRLSLPNLGAPR